MHQVNNGGSSFLFPDRDSGSTVSVFIISPLSTLEDEACPSLLQLHDVEFVKLVTVNIWCLAPKQWASLGLSQPAPSRTFIALRCSFIMHAPSVWGFIPFSLPPRSFGPSLPPSVPHSGTPSPIITVQPAIRWQQRAPCQISKLCHIIQKYYVGDYKTLSSAREAPQFNLPEQTEPQDQQQLFVCTASERRRERDDSLLPNQLTAALISHSTVHIFCSVSLLHLLILPVGGGGGGWEAAACVVFCIAALSFIFPQTHVAESSTPGHFQLSSLHLAQSPFPGRFQRQPAMFSWMPSSSFSFQDTSLIKAKVGAGEDLESSRWRDARFHGSNAP